MPVTIGMYEKSREHIGPRLDQLKLDVVVNTFDKTGQFRINGATVAPESVVLDYMWLSSAINADGYQEGAFDLTLRTKSIGVLQTYNAGLDHPFYKQLSAKGTRICNSSAQAVAISEFVIGQVLALFQPIVEQRELQAKKQWKITPYREISETNWVIVGFGPIGQEVAKRVKAFGGTTLVVRRKGLPSPVADKVGTMADLQTFLPQADVVVLACPLTTETRGFAGTKVFNATKNGATLVNVARGALIDDDALVAALDSGQLAAAILDVFSEEPLPATNPFWSHPKIRLTSHTSFAGSGVRGRWDRLFLDNIQRFVKGDALANEFNPKDFP